MRTFVVFAFFLIVFVCYFSSSVGLMNSGDAPQYFTAKSLIEHKSVDMAFYQNDPHYLVYPDYAVRDGRILNMRGYITSVFMIPFYPLTEFVAPYLTFANFPPGVLTQEFGHELATTSFFVLFSVLGIYFVWKTIIALMPRRFLALFITSVLAFGTYLWKYSSYYSRQGIQVFLIGLSVYALATLLSSKKFSIFWHAVILGIWAVSYNLDTIQFIVITLCMCLYVLLRFSILITHKRQLMLASIVPTLLLVTSICFNIIWYGQIGPSLYKENIIIKDHFKGPIAKTWLSTPLWPTIQYVLFGYGKIDASAFRHFDTISDKVDTYVSKSFAQQYNFYGIFSVTPLFIFSLFSLFGLKRKSAPIILFCWVGFIVGVLCTTKYYAFWGGNQYDLRYFYPYITFLAAPTAFGISYLFDIARKLWLRLVVCGMIFVTGMWSYWMGFLGVVNMFHPVQLGERRIWIEPVMFFHMRELPTRDSIVQAAFMNRENIVIAGIFYVVAVGIIVIASSKSSSARKIVLVLKEKVMERFPFGSNDPA